MFKLKLSEAAKWMDAKLLGEDQVFQGVSTDTRSLTPGDLFVAIPGERVDGHDLIEEAAAKGAKAALISRPVKASIPLLQVSNTVLALGLLAKHYRQGFAIPFAAVTGSCGKTTVKEMVASIVSVPGASLASQGNLNTEVGVPLTLLKLEPKHQFAVIEMGARKKGDIQYLMSLVDPDVVLINNAGSAHIEIFGSERGIAEAKGEIYSSLKSGGIAVINEDDPHAAYWKGLIKGQKILGFSSSKFADLRCQDLKLAQDHSEFELLTPKGSIPILLNVPGRHNVQNALAASTVAFALGLSLSDIALGLKRFSPVAGRLQLKQGLNGAKLLDDTYNANPVSVKAALAVLASYPGEKIFVMGDMLELGEEAPRLHQAMGEEALALGIQKLFGFGKLTLNAVQAFGPQAQHYPDKTALISELKSYLGPNAIILIKGSRGMRMEEVVQGVLASSSSNRENHPC